jgi:hypothetical protein
MRIRTNIGVAILASAALGFAAPGVAADSGRPAVAEARQVVHRFFQTLNDRKFAKTCELMSKRFYRANHIQNKRRCMLGLAATFSNTATVHFRVVSIRSDQGRTTLRVLANGAPGTIVLVREDGRLKILSIQA